jgi:hypothetical protein
MAIVAPATAAPRFCVARQLLVEILTSRTWLLLIDYSREFIPAGSLRRLRAVL